MMMELMVALVDPLGKVELQEEAVEVQVETILDASIAVSKVTWLENAQIKTSQEEVA